MSFANLRDAPSLEGNTVICVKAPQDSVSAIEVADPAETGVCFTKILSPHLK